MFVLRLNFVERKNEAKHHPHLRCQEKKKAPAGGAGTCGSRSFRAVALIDTKERSFIANNRVIDYEALLDKHNPPALKKVFLFGEFAFSTVDIRKIRFFRRKNPAT
jgi:hypothetical protein